MLSVALTWQRMMRREFFVKTIDVAVSYLFSWNASQVSYLAGVWFSGCVASLTLHATAVRHGPAPVAPTHTSLLTRAGEIDMFP